ncbi:MAG: T9SS type A sorting domain-containing protein [Bacteroidota bacterium]
MYKYLPLLLFACLTESIAAQSITWEYLAPMPEKVTNNAVTSVTIGDETYLYSFAGIDTTLDCNGDHLRSYRYTLSTNSWDTIPDLPDPNGGKIAASANVIDDKIYIVGGYHLAPNCSETSSNRIHIFDPLTNAYLDDGRNLSVPIDDQVQVVWRDSLLYVVTGWSNTTNVSNVQLYNPNFDLWQQATPVGTGANWRVFGASGVIVGDTIYYAGGARPNFGFPASSFFRKGYINPDNPAEITWEGASEPLALGYRMGAANFGDQAIWIGGSDNTYNFDALAYDGSGVINPLDRIGIYEPSSDEWSEIFGFIPAIMDLRGVAELGNGEYLLAGGMLADQEVTDQLLKISISDLTSTEPLVVDTEEQVTLFPNPVKEQFWLDLTRANITSAQWSLLDATGKVVKMGEVDFTSESPLSVGSLPAGQYWLRLEWAGGGQLLPLVKT